jgi:hypothetical protein
MILTQSAPLFAGARLVTCEDAMSSPGKSHVETAVLRRLIVKLSTTRNDLAVSPMANTDLAELLLYVSPKANPPGSGSRANRKLISWYDAVFRLAHAVAGPFDWRLARIKDARRKKFGDLIDTTMKHLWVSSMFGGVERAAAARRMKRLLRQQNRHLKSLKASGQDLDQWYGNYREAHDLLWQLGSEGYLAGAIVLVEDGSQRSIAQAAWSTLRNVELFDAHGLFEAGDAPLSPWGTPLLPESLVQAWCELVIQLKAHDFAAAAAALRSAPRPGERIKAWLHRVGVDGRRLELPEALRLARLYQPGAPGDAIKRVAKKLQTTAARSASEKHDPLGRNT